jgi:uncharacterized 2Fe-2S/4Fe-4S cluster protein (DUF4445 family)
VAQVEITFQPEGKRAKVESGCTILEAVKLLGVDLTIVCGGEGRCGKCKVIIEDQNCISSLSDIERKLLPGHLISAGYRLACFTGVYGPTTVRIPEESRTGKQRLQVEGIDTRVVPDPTVRKFFLKMTAPTMDDIRSDIDRLLEALASGFGLKAIRVSYNVIPFLPSLLRENNWKVTAVVWNGEKVIAVEGGDTVDRNFGYAIDIGTTKLAGYLLDLRKGKVMAVESLMNPQIPFGEDVITRITHAGKGKKEQGELQEAVVGGLNKMLERLLDKTGVKPEEVYETVAVGNTAMHHLFLNLCPKFLGLSPYPPVIKKGINVKARELGIKINQNGNVYVLPIIAGFVGADSVADVLATEIYKNDEPTLTIDVGTNTEIIMGNKEWMIGCSCASGPAFEGAHIKHGMRAATGAIERVRIDPVTQEVTYKTIDNAKPCGICGSAIVDVPGELLKAGIIDVRGIFNQALSTPRLRKSEGIWEFVIAWKDETAMGKDVVVTQKDLGEIQLAKAAIYTGVAILMKEAKITEADIEKVLIAGAFGFYIDPDSARIIGMYPEIPLSKVKAVGNSAGTGARMALVSRKARQTCNQISRDVKYVELANDPVFQSIYMNAYFLPNAELNKWPETCGLLKRLGRYPETLPPIIQS